MRKAELIRFTRDVTPSRPRRRLGNLHETHRPTSHVFRARNAWAAHQRPRVSPILLRKWNAGSQRSSQRPARSTNDRKSPRANTLRRLRNFSLRKDSSVPRQERRRADSCDERNARLAAQFGGEFDELGLLPLSPIQCPKQLTTEHQVAPLALCCKISKLLFGRRFLMIIGRKSQHKLRCALEINLAILMSFIKQ